MRADVLSCKLECDVRLTDNRAGKLASVARSQHRASMLVFIDESGDPGFKVASGSSPVFVMAMVIFKSGEAAAQTSEIIEALRADLGFRTEFKFNKSREEVRSAFLTAVSSCPFRVRAIVVEKERIRSAVLRENKEAFYNFFLKTMVRFDNGRLANARVVIDGSGDRSFRQGLAKHVSRNSAKGAIRDIRFQDSANDPLVQLADMCAGAIARSYRSDRTEPNRWRAMLRKRIEDVWNFFAKLRPASLSLRLEGTHTIR